VRRRRNQSEEEAESEWLVGWLFLHHSVHDGFKVLAYAKLRYRQPINDCTGVQYPLPKVAGSVKVSEEEASRGCLKRGGAVDGVDYCSSSSTTGPHDEAQHQPTQLKQITPSPPAFSTRHPPPLRSPFSQGVPFVWFPSLFLCCVIDVSGVSVVRDS
jgi:hypothetical protein